LAYTPPQLLLYQELQASPLALADPLRACVVGPFAELFRYADADEKVLARLGAYNPAVETAYAYPNKPAGSLVDLGYVKVYGDDVLLKYFEDLIGSDSTVAPVAGYKNRVRSNSVNFAESELGETTYARNAALYDRDVKVGDVVDIRGVVDDEVYSLRTTVRGLIGDTVAGVVGSAEADAANVADTLAAATVSLEEGPVNCIEATASGAGYSGLESGDIEETYTITVVEGSVGGDLTTARLRVVSASGRDNVASVTPSASGVATEIGTRGLTVTWTNDPGTCSESATSEGVSSEDFVAGQVWVAEVSQAFAAPVATAAGTYTKAATTTYIVTVTKGGDAATATKPQISAITTHGTDASGPTNVTAAATAIPIGTGGVTISFDEAKLRKNDVYYVEVTGQGAGPVRTLVLAHSLPDALYEDATDLDLKLYIKKSGVLVDAHRYDAAPAVNYEADRTELTVGAGMVLTDADWTDGGELLGLDVAEATLYVEYRAWLPGPAEAVDGISDVADLGDLPGPLHPDNPGKWGVYKALSNSNGTEVKYLGVADPDDADSWVDALDKLTGRDDVYGLVPLTRDGTVLSLFAAHVAAQSGAEAKRWRTAWVSPAVDDEVAIVSAATSDDDEVVLATVSDNPAASGTQYTLFQITSGNASLEDLGVRVGDVARYTFTTDGWGDVSYAEYEVEEIVSEDSFLVAGEGLDAAVGVARKLEIYRPLTAADRAERLIDAVAAYGTRRVLAVVNETVGDGGLTFPGYHLCAALAGLRSGVVPHQGLTNLPVAGFDDVTGIDQYSYGQLNDLAEAGAWIVFRDQDRNVVTRHALTTTGAGDVLTQEEMVTANVDQISYVVTAELADLVGKANVTPSTLELIRLRLTGVFAELGQTYVDRLGPQVIEVTDVEVRQHRILKDRVVVNATLTVPVPMNNIEVHLQIVA
jgi:hypothetical protein